MDLRLLLGVAVLCACGTGTVSCRGSSAGPTVQAAHTEAACSAPAPEVRTAPWVTVAETTKRPESMPAELLIAYTVDRSRDRVDRRIRVADIGSGVVRELDWPVPDVVLPTLVDRDHVLFSSANKDVCLASLPDQTVKVLAHESSIYSGLGYCAATREVMFAGPGSTDYARSLWALPVDASCQPHCTGVEWYPLTDGTRHRRVRFTYDGSFVSLPVRPLDVSRDYDIARVCDGALLDMDVGGGAELRYSENANGVDFGRGCLYWLCFERTDLPSRLVRRSLEGADSASRVLREFRPDGGYVAGCLAVSEALGVVAVDHYGSPGAPRTIALGHLDGGPIWEVCEGQDPDIWPR